MPWVETSIVTTDWAKQLQLVVNGVDVTYWLGVPVEPQEWDRSEPFGPKTLVVKFPQITMWPALPAWLVDYANVELYRVLPDDSKELLFEGIFVEDEGTYGKDSGDLTLTFLGALYQADLYRRAPELVTLRSITGETDLNYVVRRELDPGRRPALRTLPVIVPGTAGVQWREQGSWQPLLTGFIADALAVATNSGLPAPGEGIVGITALPNDAGYFLTGTAGSVLCFGDARYQGSILGVQLNEPGSRLALNSTGTGYWIAARDGGVFALNAGFFGSTGGSGNPNDVIAIEGTADDKGYWLADVVGGVFAFGTAGFYGSLPGPGAPDLVAGESIVDLARSHGGAGYLLLSNTGRIYAFGDAVNSGNGLATGKTFSAMARRQAGGYWLLATDGTVYGYGGAATYAPNPVPYSQKAVDIYGTSSGAGYLVVDAVGGVFALGDAIFRGSVPGGGGTDSQWTLALDPGRRPVMRVKNVWDVKANLRAGAKGITLTLRRDRRDSPNRYFGEGTDPNGQRWRNSRYPNQRPDPAPVFGGTNLTIGSTIGDVAVWEREMHERWSQALVIDGRYSQSDSNACRLFQRQAGVPETGIVDASTWAAVFSVGSNGGDLDGAFFAPLDQDPRVDPYLYNAMGTRIGANPAFDRGVMVVETYDNYGSRVPKDESIFSAAARRRRDAPAKYQGTITLAADPPECSRFDLREGHNVKVLSYQGQDVLMHIANVKVNWTAGTVTLTVDQGARDYLTLAAIRKRGRDTVVPSRVRTYRNSRAKTITDDQPVFDSESGAGVIPRHAIGAGRWNMLRIPMAAAGTLVMADFTTDNTTTAKISVALFDRLTTAVALQARGGTPLDDGYWDTFDDNWGLVEAFGGFGNAGGYFRGRESDGDPITGRTRDSGQWYFESTRPPWMWVALWCNVSTYIQGFMVVEAA